VVIRGDIWWADLLQPQGSEPGYRRPVHIVQADEITASRIQTVLVVALTSNTRLAEAPGNVFLPKEMTGLSKDSVANVTQVLTIDKDFLTEQAGVVGRLHMRQIEDGLRLVLSLQ
jgi:mRNA interferase MazF